jgi:hypothetical protein
MISAPTFEVRQLKSTPRWYVQVLWQHGQEQHITGFTSADDAQSWISSKVRREVTKQNTALRADSMKKAPALEHRIDIAEGAGCLRVGRILKRTSSAPRPICVSRR